MKYLFMLLFSLLPVSALADSYPALFNVSGVASNDVLNIRSAPNASGTLVGSLTYNATGVEVIRPSDTGTWGLVNSDEGTGWVSLQFLTRTTAQWAYPAPVSCHGTEPFWGLELSGNGPVAFDLMGSGNMLFNTQTQMTAAGRPDRHSFVAGGTDGIVHAVVSYATCSDGMSDREYGLTLDLLYRGPDGYTQFAGCCSLAQ